jgi:hypothetical protein
MCSKCYRDFVLTQAKASSAKTAEHAAAAAAVSAAPVAELLGEKRSHVEISMPQILLPEAAGAAAAPSSAAASSASASGQDPSRPKPNRCFTCKKRVGLTGFECRCGNLFCSSHRYSDKHSCTFDYKMAGRDAISKANPVVKADKVNKI